jgi:putative NADPH-quinone reductase
MRIGLSAGRTQVSPSRERRLACLEALAEGAFAVRQDLMRSGDFKPPSGRLQDNERLDLRRPPTALFVSKNLITAGALAAIHHRGLRLPQDVATVGFDDLPWAEALEPPLTVVRQPAAEAGQQAMELLVKRSMEPARAPVTVCLLPARVARRSTEPWAGPAAETRQNARTKPQAPRSTVGAFGLWWFFQHRFPLRPAMKKMIAIVQGHPDPDGRHYGHALAAAYADAAVAAGYQVNVIDVARLEFPPLRFTAEFDHGAPPAVIRDAQTIIGRAEHLVIFPPLWLGAMPARLKEFWAQVFRPGLAGGAADFAPGRKAKRTEKSARIVVSMGMPARFYRWYFGAHSLNCLARNSLGFCGIGPIKENLIGLVETEDVRRREKWLERMRGLGRAGA